MQDQLSLYVILSGFTKEQPKCQTTLLVTVHCVCNYCCALCCVVNSYRLYLVYIMLSVVCLMSVLCNSYVLCSLLGT